MKRINKNVSTTITTTRKDEYQFHCILCYQGNFNYKNNGDNKNAGMSGKEGKLNASFIL